MNHTFAAMEERNDIVIYQSEDGLVKMEAMVDPAGETIWATQKAIAALFGVTVPNISYHLGRIFRSGELEPDAVVKEILITAQSGARGLSDDKVRYYNLDAIISIGYKVNSIRATKFRIWAANVIKQYMLKGYAVNRNAVSEQKYEDLKRAMGLLENVFNKELLLSSDQVTDLFDVIRDYTYALDTLDAYDYQSGVQAYSGDLAGGGSEGLDSAMGRESHPGRAAHSWPHEDRGPLPCR